MKKINQTIIIAEAGVNHNGSLKLAKKLIDAASYAKADYVKFQTFKSELIFSKNSPKAKYAKLNTNKNESALEMVKKLELSIEDHLLLKKYCKKKKIKYLTTFSDLESLKHYKKFNLDYIKIASGDINNLILLENISKTKKKVILSTGISNIKEIDTALKILTKKINKKITVLHCNTNYPARFDEINLNAIKFMKKKFNVDIGYSDHTSGIEVSLAATALGASIIEKHFTLDKKMPGPDHKASLSPRELCNLVKGIKIINKSLGDSKKIATKSELKNKIAVRKSIFASKKIIRGEKFTYKNLVIKRPGNGISPMLIKKLINKKSKFNFEEDEMIKL